MSASSNLFQPEADTSQPVTMFGPDFPFAYDDWLKHPSGLGTIPQHKHGAEVAVIGAGMHVGEIALLEPFKGRAATVHVIDAAVVAQVSGQKFTEIASHYPEMWRRIGVELARRLVRLEKSVYEGVTV